jgi:hypothetical protein
VHYAGPEDDLVLPKESNQVDWEVELGVVIGKGGRYDGGEGMCRQFASLQDQPRRHDINENFRDLSPISFNYNLHKSLKG